MSADLFYPDKTGKGFCVAAEKKRSYEFDRPQGKGTG